MQNPTKYQCNEKKDLFDIFSERKTEGNALEKLYGVVMRKDEYACLQSMRTGRECNAIECNYKDKRGKTVYGLNCDWR